MELNEYVATLRKHAVAIVVVALLGAVAAFGYAKSQTPLYTAKVSLYVVVPGGESVGERVQGATYAEGRIASYAQLASQPFVLEPVIAELGMSSSVRSVASNVSTTTTLNTSFLEIGYTHENPERAAEVANAIAEQLARAVGDLEGEGPRAAAIELTVVADAEPPTYPSAPNTKLLVAAGLIAGLAGGVLMALARGLLDTRIRGLDDVRRATETPVLSVVRRARRRTPETPVAFQLDPFGEQAEAYRRLRANLQFLDAGSHRRSLLVTSSVDGEGKSATALNLAVALAERSRRVVLVDANLRRPGVASTLGLSGAAGLTTVLIGEGRVEDVVQPWRDNLDVIASGVLPPNPSDLLESPAMAALMDRLAARYDAVVVDAPSLRDGIDGVVLSRLVDGVLVVVGCSAVRRAELTGALQVLEAVDANVLGLVVNKTARVGARGAFTYTAAARSGRHRRLSASRARGDVDPETDELASGTWFPDAGVPAPRVGERAVFARPIPLSDLHPTEEIVLLPDPDMPAFEADEAPDVGEVGEDVLPSRGGRDGASG